MRGLKTMKAYEIG